LLHRSIVGENGSGHGDLFTGPDGQMYYVYHVHYSETQVTPRRTRIVPIIKTWNDKTNLFDFKVEANGVIVPQQVSE
ncbi:MAG: beta-xylosidase, partial [Marinoscillum sp.]